MAMQHVGSNYNHRSRLNCDVAKMVGINCRAGNRSYRWIESKSLIEDGPGLRQGIHSLGNIRAGSSSFRRQTFAPFGRL